MSSAPNLSLLIDRKTIEQRVQSLGKEVQTTLETSERPVAIVILQGSFVFAADLLREITSDLGLEVGFMRCDSYGNQTQSSGKVILMTDLDPSLDLNNRTVLLIDDILDTGQTLEFLVNHLSKRGAKKILTCVLLRRTKNIQSTSIQADYAGFDIGDEFVVGYGMDYAGKHRNLPDLHALIQDQKEQADDQE